MTTRIDDERRRALDGGLSASDADALLAHVLGKNTAYLRANGDAPMDEKQAVRARELFQRRISGEPLAYLVGSAGFYGREFTVDARVLIPRPETEHLVDAAIAFLRSRDTPHLLDVGVGSGAIACSIAAEVETVRVDAVDISPDALEVAAINRDRLHLQRRIAFYLGDLLEPVAGKRYDAIVANLPYVPGGQGDPDLRFEPAIALYSGADGLDAYRRFFAAAPSHVRPGGIVLAEGAPPIAAGLLALAETAFPNARVTLERDYGGRERLVAARCG